MLKVDRRWGSGRSICTAKKLIAPDAELGFPLGDH